MNETPTITKFFDWLAGHSDPENAARLRDEWTSVPMRYNFGLLARDPSEWPQLVDEYDERVALMCEDRQPEDDDMLAAWEQVLGIGRYQKQTGSMVMAAGGPWQFTEEGEGGAND